MKRNDKTLKLVLAALFLALALLLPLITGQIPKIGSALCPMHLPILLCGFLCGWQAGLVVGLTAPLIRSLTTGLPVFFPVATCMALELASYGAVAGVAHRLLPKKKPYIYCSLLIAMIVGRLVWGTAMFFFMRIGGLAFSPGSFLSGAVTGAIPGILLQILVIPILVMTLDRPNLSYEKEQKKHD